MNLKNTITTHPKPKSMFGTTFDTLLDGSGVVLGVRLPPEEVVALVLDVALVDVGLADGSELLGDVAAEVVTTGFAVVAEDSCDVVNISVVAVE